MAPPPPVIAFAVLRCGHRPGQCIRAVTDEEWLALRAWCADPYQAVVVEFPPEYPRSSVFEGVARALGTPTPFYSEWPMNAEGSQWHAVRAVTAEKCGPP